MMAVLSEDQRPDDGMLHIGHEKYSVSMRKVKASWWDLSAVLRFPLSLSRLPITSLTTIRTLLSQPTSRSKDPHRYRYRWIVFCHDSHNPLCLQTYVLCLAFFLVTIMSYHTFLLQLWWFCLLSAPLWFRCLHTPYCYLFLANWSVCSPALNF